MEASPPPLPDARDSSTPLTESDYVLIREATSRLTAIRKAAATATRSSAITLTLGVIGAVLVAVWFSWPGLLITAGLLVVGFVEQWGGRSMGRVDPAAPKILVRNQIGFCAVIVVYCVWQMMVFSGTDPVSPEIRQLDGLPGFENLIGDLETLTPRLTYGFYGLVIALSLFFQLRLAGRYHARRHDIAAYGTDTPDWVKRMMDEAQV